MKPFQVSRDASADLDDIFLYWAERASIEVAERLVDAIVDRFWIIGKFPGAGRTCDQIESGVRVFPAGKYLIYYRRWRRGIRIVRVLHGSRHQKRAFRR